MSQGLTFDFPPPSGHHAARYEDQRDEIVLEVCERLGAGEPLAQICREAHMPTYETVLGWQQRFPLVASAIARAREHGFDSIAQDAILIIDGLKPVDGVPPDPSRDKGRADVRLKLLAKWDPKRYGDMQQIRHADADGGKLDNSALVGEFVALMKPQGTPPAPVKALAYDDVSDLV